MAKMQELYRIKNGGLVDSVDGTKLGPYPTEHVTSLRMKSTSLKWLIRAIAAIVSLLFIAGLALRTERVQSAVARQLAMGFEKQTGLRLDFESLHIDWWNRQFALTHCRLGQPEQELPLLDIATIKLGAWHRTRGTWQLGTLHLSGAEIDASGLTQWNALHANPHTTAQKRPLSVSLQHVFIENFAIRMNVDSDAMSAVIDRMECRNIELFLNEQHGELIDLKGRVAGDAFGHDSINISMLSGIWSSDATSWHWDSGIAKSSLLNIHGQADGEWENWALTELTAEAQLEQGVDFPHWSQKALDHQNIAVEWGQWLSSQLNPNKLQGALEVHWEKPTGWLISMHEWTGLPGISSIDNARWEQKNDGKWDVSGELKGSALKTLKTLGSTPVGSQQSQWIDSLTTRLGTNDEWGVHWRTENQSIQADWELTLETQQLPLTGAVDWKPSAESHEIDWESHNIPAWLGIERGYGQAWAASGRVDWSSNAILGQTQLTLSNNGTISATVNAYRNRLKDSLPEWSCSGTITSQDNPMPLELSWTGSIDRGHWNWESESLLLGFQPFLLSEREDWELHARTALRVNGMRFSEIQMIFEMREINLLQNGRPMAFNRMDIEGSWSAESSMIAWNSDLTNGYLNLENDWKRWGEYWTEKKLLKNTNDIESPQFQAECSVRSFAPIAALAHLPFSIESGSRLKAYSQIGGTKFQLSIPHLTWDLFEASGIQIDLDDQAQSIFINAQCDSLHRAGVAWIEQAQIDISRDSIWWLDSSWDSPQFGHSEMQWSALNRDLNCFNLQLINMSLPIGNQIFESDLPHPQLNLDFTSAGMELSCDNFSLTSENWTLNTSGLFSPVKESFWTVNAVGKTFPFIEMAPYNDFSGKNLDARFEWCRLEGVSAFAAAFQGEKFGFNALQLENFNLLMDGDKSNATYWLAAQIDTESSISATGNLALDLEGPMHSELKLESVPLQWLNTWMPPESVQWSGVISGDLLVEGTPKKPSIEGWFASDSAAVHVGYLGTTYQLKGLCEVVPDEFFLDQWEAQDSEGHIARINGTIMHDHFTDWNFDVGLEAEVPFQLLQLTREDNDWFYGTAYATGDVNVFGYDNNLQIEARLKTGPETRFALPLDGASDASYASFIHFHDPREDLVEITKDAPDLSRFRVDLNIDVTEDAEARIIFDESVGDEIMGVVVGDLSIGINDFEQIDMTGQLEVVEGAYFFTLQNLINKQFEIEPGGTISWFGDPYEAAIDLNTIYKVRTNLDGLLPDESNLPGRIPVHLNLALQGALMQPDIGFSINLPEATPQLTSLVEGALINEEELNRQALSLLVLNQFLSPDPLTSGFGGDLVQDQSTAFIANQLGHWISQISPDMDIGFDYGNNPSDEDQSLAVALSTRLLDDRLHVEGAIGTNQLSQVAASNVQLQDMTISYDLDANGTFQVTGHTRQNPEWSSPYGATTQGVGLRFQREFNHWGERRKRRDASLNEGL